MNLEKQTYEAYQAVENSWVTRLPAHWQFARHSSLFEERNEKGYDDLMLLSVSQKYGVLPQSELNIKKDVSSSDKSNYKRVLPGDIAYNKMRMWQGAVGVSSLEGIVSPAYVVFHARQDNLDPTYFGYVYKTQAFIEEVGRWSYGIHDDQNSLRYEDFKVMYSPLPPLPEQRAIVTFLDRETAQLDALLERKQRLLELLEEQRRAVISQAVTRGLNPDAPLKDSGVPWLGLVPEGWEVMKLSHICTMIRDGTHTPPSRVDIGFPLLSVRNIINGELVFREDDSMISEHDFSELQRSFTIKQGDILLAIVGATLGKSAVVGRTPQFQIQRSLAIFRCRPNLSPVFLDYIFKSEAFQKLLWSNVGFSAQPGIYLTTLAQFRISVPPPSEQQAIAAYLDSETAKLDALRLKLEQSMEQLKEYRSALITAAVTGQIDVSGAGAQGE